MVYSGKLIQSTALVLLLVATAQTRLCPDPVCPQDDGENRTVLLPSVDCRNFYSCTWGFPTLLACPPSLRFSEKIPGCVPEILADCGPCEDPEVDETNGEETKAGDQKEPQEENLIDFINFFPIFN